jgi:hypothetical protein
MCDVRNSRVLLPVLLVLSLLAGCKGQTGPDSNTQVFQTAEQAAAARKEKLLLDWQEMAARIANGERPDIRTSKARGFALHLSADGVEQDLDLTPISEKLMSALGKERHPIHAYLAEKFPAFDRARLEKMGFARARAMLYPYLANTKQTSSLAGLDTTHPPIVNPVVLDLNWVPVARWPGTSAQTAIDAELASDWKVTGEQVNAAAMANLRKTFADRTQSPFETIDLPGMGRYGSLRSDVDPTILLLPDFVAAVRKEWKTDGDLVISFPSRTTVNFLERKNEKLLNRMIPEWTRLATVAPQPMLSTMLLAGDKGLSLLNYAPPSTRPVTKPATQPKKVHIVQ